MITLNEDEIRKGITIAGDLTMDEDRNWKVKGRNIYQPEGWDIKNGSTHRLIFPIDFQNYVITIY